MKYLFAFILLAAVACDSCKNLDCVGPPYDSFQFTYTDTDGNDLLGGTFKKYEENEIKVYALDETDTKVFALLYFESFMSSTIVNVQLNYPMERSFLEVKGEVTDTLDFDITVNKTECCGTMRTIDETALNGENFEGEFPIQIQERE